MCEHVAQVAGKEATMTAKRSSTAPGMRELLLQLQPADLENRFWDDPAVKRAYLQTDAYAYWITIGNIGVGWGLTAGLSDRRTATLLKAACVFIFITTSLQRRLLHAPQWSRVYDRLAGLNRLMRGIWMLVFFKGMKPEDMVNYYFVPRLASGMPPRAILAMAICAYCIVHGMQSLTYRIRFSHMILVHTCLLACAWPLLCPVREALRYPGLQQAAHSSCQQIQDASLLLHAWASSPWLAMYRANPHFCERQSTDFLLAFAVCTLGMLLPAYVCYCREGLLKAEFLRKATSDQATALQWLRHPRSHVILLLGILLLGHTLAEVILAFKL